MTSNNASADKTEMDSFLDVKEIARQKCPEIKNLSDLKHKLSELNKSSRQQRKSSSTSSKSNENDNEDEAESKRTFQKKFKVIRFIIISAMKLKLNDLTLATASCIFHRFFSTCRLSDFDPYLIATASIYLACKIEEDEIKLRDILNVCYRTLHPQLDSLQIGEMYWSLRNSIIHTELLIVRMLSFKLEFDHPHKYLLLYLDSLRHWLPLNIRSCSPVPETSWHMLRDLLHSDMFTRHGYRAQSIAIAVIYLVSECYGVKIPYNELAQKQWWKAFDDKTSRACIHEIVERILDVYELEKAVFPAGSSNLTFD